jgi:hypothetical protein
MLIDNEDLKEVKETFHGFAVEAKRMLKYGCWTGFITVPSDHPWSISHNSITVHGGVTYYKNTIKGISVGFDCAHFGDALPQWASRSQMDYGEYRDINFVIGELKELAKQAKQASK